MGHGCQGASRRGEDFWLTLSAWASVLDMAGLNGWYPEGTRVPADMQEQPWPEDYLSAQGQWVSEEDAGAMASALGEVLDEVPDEDDYTPFDPEDEEQRILLVAEVDHDFHELFSGPAKGYLSDLLAFLASGEFMILDDYRIEDDPDYWTFQEQKRLGGS